MSNGIKITKDDHLKRQVKQQNFFNYDKMHAFNSSENESDNKENIK